jgi:GTP-binding protein EngB required for normal cell division
MGGYLNNDNQIKNKNDNINKDANIKGDLNIYVCGNINPISNSDDEFDLIDLTSSRYLYIFEKIFEKKETSKNGNINFKDNLEINYQYEFRKKEINNKVYNAFLFMDKTNEEFFDVLFGHLLEIDAKNENKNVIIFIGENDEEIIKSLDKLYNKSNETVPFLIIVNNSNYSEKLKYINYIPNLNTIEDILEKSNPKLQKYDLQTLCENALINYINTKLFRIDMFYNQCGYNLNILNPMNEVYLKIKIHVTIGLLGYSGCGKSTLINIIFKELVARTSSSSTDVTKKCEEYYLPIEETDNEECGQIRFLDFPGITEDNIYYKEVEPEIKKKLKEYKENMERIDVALFFLNTGKGRLFNNAGFKLVNLLLENNIKIIFVFNGFMKKSEFNTKIKSLRNTKEIEGALEDDLSNIINTDYSQSFKEVEKEGISKIFEKIIEMIKIKDEKFKVEDINVQNYNEKLKHLSKSNGTFALYNNMNAIKEKAKYRANWAVAAYSTATLGSSSLSLIVPVVDCAITIGWQVAMVYTIFNIYELNPKDYDIVSIVITGGTKIEEKPKIIKGNLNGGVQVCSNGAVFVAKCGVQTMATKEAGKVVVEKTIKTVVTDSIEAAAISATSNTMEAIVVNTIEQTVTQSVEKIAIESTKQLAEAGLKEGTKTFVNVATGSAIGVVSESGGEFIIAVSKESVKEITETIIIKQGGKFWLINLGKAVPFIGAGIIGVINTYSTSKLGKRLIAKFDEDFDKNQQRQVDLIKSRIYGLYHIIEQMKKIIDEQKDELIF